jgi:hypothetical protein
VAGECFYSGKGQSAELKIKHIGVVVFMICPLLAAQQPASQPEVSASPRYPAQESLNAPAAASAVLADGTPVVLHILETVSSADAFVGKQIAFEVADDVKLGETVVIAKGSPAFGTVTRVKMSEMMGESGAMEFSLDYVRMVNGEEAKLSAFAGGEGGSRTGAVITAAILVSPAFLFIYGKDKKVRKGATITAYIRGDVKVKIDGARVLLPPTSLSAADLAALPDVALTFSSDPAGAEIIIDGESSGVSPVTTLIRPGTHQVSVKKKGYLEWKRAIDITGRVMHVTANLEPVGVH